mmetsp:Transcript_45988/g.72991  ORF Transcript_45988/g.72991 Transcript_45988/m.72991 type:complete len:83 (-) Transcript_45988:507-755(-)
MTHFESERSHRAANALNLLSWMLILMSENLRSRNCWKCCFLRLMRFDEEVGFFSEPCFGSEKDGMRCGKLALLLPAPHLRRP